MSIELSFDAQDLTVAGRVTVAPHEVDVPSGASNVLNNPDLSQVAGLDIKYWKVFPPQVGGQVVPMAAQEQAAWDAKLAADLLAAQKASAKGIIEGSVDLGKLARAEVDIIIQQFNLHTVEENTLLAAVAAATSLSDLKTRCALITQVATATLSGAKTAVEADIDSGGEGN
jgi:hypothetical protein